jgi:hypothetical protein
MKRAHGDIVARGAYRAVSRAAWGHSPHITRFSLDARLGKSEEHEPNTRTDCANQDWFWPNRGHLQDCRCCGSSDSLRI